MRKSYQFLSDWADFSCNGKQGKSRSDDLVEIKEDQHYENEI